MSTDTSLPPSTPQPQPPQAQSSHARTDSLFVGNLSYFCNNDHLWTLFSPHGNVQSAIVCRAKNKDPLYYGFVNVAAGAGVEAAIAALNNSFFMGRRLKVMRSSRGSGESQATPRHSSSSQDIDQGYQILVSFVSAASGGSASAPPFHVNEDCLFHVFSRFGAVLDVLVKQYTHSTASAGPPPPPGYPHAYERPATLHKQCGYGFVLFEDWAAAQQAMAATRLDPQGDQTLGIKLDCRLSTLTAQKLRREGIVIDDATATGAPDHASYRTKAPKQQPPHHPPQLQPQPQPQQLAGYTGVSFGGAPQPPQLLQSPYGYAVYGGPASSGPPSSSSSPLQAPWPQAPGSSPQSASSSSSHSPPPAALHAPNAAAFAYPTAYPPQWQQSPHSAAMGSGSGGGSPPPPPPPSYASSPSLLYVPVQLQPPHAQQMQQYQQQLQMQQYQQFHQLRQLQPPFQSQPFQSQPFQSQPLQSQPFQSQPFQSQPFQSQPLQSQPFQSQAPMTQQPQPQTPQGYAVAQSHSLYAAAAYAPHGQPKPQHSQHPPHGQPPQQHSQHSQHSQHGQPPPSR